MRFKQTLCPNPEKSSNKVSQNLRDALLAHWDGKCAYCEAALCTTPGPTHYHADHVLNGFHANGCHHGISNKSWNVALCCPQCNIIKGSQNFGADGALYHAAINRWMELGCEGTIPEMYSYLATRFYKLLYAPVKGFDAHMDSFPGKTALKGKLFIRNVGDQFNPVWEII